MQKVIENKSLENKLSLMVSGFSFFWFTMVFLKYFMGLPLYFSLIGVPIIGSIILFLLPAHQKGWIRMVALQSSSWVLYESTDILFQMDYGDPSFQLTGFLALALPWCKNNFISFGIDGISVFFVWLTGLLIFLCIFASTEDVIKVRLKDYYISFLVLEALLMGVFTVLDLLFFYVLFEATLIPMFIMILVWGSRERKIRAAAMLFLYTLIGSVFLLLCILYLSKTYSYTDYSYLQHCINSSECSLTLSQKRIIWIAFFVSFATKTPMIPFHLWLPEAHVEAPTAGSVLLAGILLKLGSYGFIRYCIGLFPEASKFFSPLVFVLATVGVIYTSFTAIRQTDFKRIVAYTSVAHMSLGVIGIFTLNITGIKGAILLSLGHGFVSSALFFIIGVVYERFHTRLIKYYSGLVLIMPLYIIIFLFFTMANIGLPGTSNFVGEFLILCGLYIESTTICFLGATGMILGGAYSLWLFNRVAFGNLKRIGYDRFHDLSLKEFLVFFPLIVGTLVMGIYPLPFTDVIDCSTFYLVESMNLALALS